MYDNALESIKNNENYGCERPGRCPAKKTCKALITFEFNSGFWCAGLTWQKKDMDILKVCCRRDNLTDIMRMTPPEARIFMTLLSSVLMFFDEALDPEYRECMNNMAEMRFKPVRSK
jgi:hypothetical protein